MSAATRPHVVATAGHVDHGKSRLVRALTGTDPDRLAEEKRRGLTIELGFARLDLDGVGPVAVVDVPGHERFVATMLAGVAVVEAVILCVDAGEGWRAQTEEHLRIVELAGVTRGVVALTKAATVGAARRSAAIAEARARLAGTALDGVPLVACDAVAGTGLDDLTCALTAVLLAAPPPPDGGRPRLWVDRSFAVAGAGAVVTGGIAHGGFSRGDRVEVVTPAGPVAARVRGLQHFGADVERAPAGSRAALNLAGASHRAIGRGDAVVRPGEWDLVDEVEVDLRVLAAAPSPVRSRGAHLAYLGSEEMAVRLRVERGGAVEPGERAVVRLRLPRRLPLAVGDRVVLRDAGRRATVAGGPVVGVAPNDRRAAASRGAVHRSGHPGGAGEAPGGSGDAGRPSPHAALLALIESTRPVGLDLATVGRPTRDACRDLAAGGSVLLDHGYAVVPAWAAELGAHPFLASLRTDPFAPPPLDGSLGPGELRALTRRRLVAGRDGVWFAAEAVTDAAERLRGAAADGAFTLADARDVLGTSRRYALALCELLDAAGVTARRGDTRRFLAR